MLDLDRWAEIWASVKANKLRTFLSGITISLALFVFITLFGLSKGLQNGFEIEFFPPNVKAIDVVPGITTLAYKGNNSGRTIVLKNADYQFLKDSLNGKIEAILPTTTKSVIAKNFSEKGSYVLEGTIPEKKIVEEHTMLSGRFIDEFDGKDLEKNIVIGRYVEKDLFKNEKAVGKTLQLGNTLFKIIGVFSDADGDEVERKIYIPLRTLQVIYGSDAIDELTLLPHENSSLSEIKEIALYTEKILKARHFVSPDDKRGINVYDPSEGLKTTDLFFMIFTIIVLIIGIGSLIAGVVSIGNMMVFSVKERTKEIGIRKALGAKPSDIIGLILQESMFITLFFGAIGIILAVLLTDSLKDSFKDYLIYDPTVETSRIVMAAIILFIAGLLAGFLPARKAARIKPIEALRQD